MLGLDVGFGWTKWWTKEKKGKFPTWIGLWENYSISDITPIEFEGEKYVVGEEARFCRQKIEIVDYEDMIRFLPLIALYVSRITGLTPYEMVTGLAPKHYAKFKQDKEAQLRLNEFNRILFQGLGVLIDMEESIRPEEGESLILVDIGFNTVDVLLLLWTGEKYKKIAVESFEGLGVRNAVERFREKLRIEHLKSQPASKLVKIFQESKAKIEGREYYLNEEVKEAKQSYKEVLLTRLKEAFGEKIEEADHMIVAGGGAYLVEKLRYDTIVPKEPEFSNARGYTKS